MKVDGRCLCGATSWEAEVEPSRVFVCHCEDCQVQSGAPFRSTVITDPSSFRLTAGELRTWNKTAESGARRTLAFCPTCGTNVYGGPADGEKGFMSLRVGALTQRDELDPVAQLWCRSRRPWTTGLGDLQAFDRQPGARPPEDG